MLGASRRTYLALLTFCALVLHAASIKLVIGPGMKECVAETVQGHHFDVPGGPRLDGRVMVSGNHKYYVPFVSITLVSSTGEVLWKRPNVYNEAHFNAAAKGPGTYKVCFENPNESRTDAVVDLVYFTLAHMRKGSTNVIIPKGAANTRSVEVAHKDHMDEVRNTIVGMSEFMQVISGSQAYLRRKLQRHEMTMLSNKNRALGYASLELVALVVVAAVQVLVIRKFFNGKTRTYISV